MLELDDPRWRDFEDYSRGLKEFLIYLKTGRFEKSSSGSRSLDHLIQPQYSNQEVTYALLPHLARAIPKEQESFTRALFYLQVAQVVRKGIANCPEFYRESCEQAIELTLGSAMDEILQLVLAPQPNSKSRLDCSSGYLIALVSSALAMKGFQRHTAQLFGDPFIETYFGFSFSGRCPKCDHEWSLPYSSQDFKEYQKSLGYG